jgi:hypothetical protein
MIGIKFDRASVTRKLLTIIGEADAAGDVDSRGNEALSANTA